MATAVAVCAGVTSQSDLSDLSDKDGAPVFALAGYAAASLVIPRGFALPPSGLARAQELPQGNAGQLDSDGGMQSAHGVTLA